MDRHARLSEAAAAAAAAALVAAVSGTPVSGTPVCSRIDEMVPAAPVKVVVAATVVMAMARAASGWVVAASREAAARVEARWVVVLVVALEVVDRVSAAAAAMALVAMVGVEKVLGPKLLAACTSCIFGRGSCHGCDTRGSRVQCHLGQQRREPLDLIQQCRQACCRIWCKCSMGRGRCSNQLRILRRGQIC